MKELDKLHEIWKELITHSHQNPLSYLLAVNTIFEVSRTNSVLQKWKGKETKNRRTFSSKFEVIQSVNYCSNRHVYGKTVKLHETIKLILRNSFRQGKDGKKCPLFFLNISPSLHYAFNRRLNWNRGSRKLKFCPNKFEVVFQDVINWKSITVCAMTAFMKLSFTISPFELNRLKYVFESSKVLLFIEVIKLELNLLIQMNVCVFE